MREKGRNVTALVKTVASPGACGSGSPAMAASRICVLRYLTAGDSLGRIQT
jgi:hypothetical protein